MSSWRCRWGWTCNDCDCSRRAASKLGLATTPSDHWLNRCLQFKSYHRIRFDQTLAEGHRETNERLVTCRLSFRRERVTRRLYEFASDRIPLFWYHLGFYLLCPKTPAALRNQFPNIIVWFNRLGGFITDPRPLLRIEHTLPLAGVSADGIHHVAVDSVLGYPGDRIVAKVVWAKLMKARYIAQMFP